MTGKPNRLINEKSPYLLQHAYNPVDWYPWGDEAFGKAKLEDKPIFLSIGYSTCHWCHVMERESFEDQEVAALLNAKFVAIKVDREERPDIDNFYMRVCQTLTGAGGWPLTVLLAPDKRAFFAGTYFPKHQHYGRMGMMELLAGIGDAWMQNRVALLEQSNAVTEAILQAADSKAAGATHITEELIESAYQNLKYNFDDKYGGFGDAPKFPTPHTLLFLLRYWRQNGAPAALRMVEKTLSAMDNGGIQDHLGGGFSRYSTDRRWLVPHFEKMLYDNALLLLAYTEAYQCTKKEMYAATARRIVDYVRRDMSDASGGFYSAEDADSEGVEGKYYVFTHREIIETLGEKNGEIFCAYYGVTKAGNFEGKNILSTIGQDWQVFLKAHHLSESALTEILTAGRNQLFALRNQRIKPHKDDKILTSWNALMIAALAVAGRVLNEPEYLEVAKRAVTFIEIKLMKNNRLYVRYRDDETAVLGYIDEYAFLLWGYIELYESTYDADFLAKAKGLADEMQRLFFDEKNGGFYFSGADGEVILTRQKEIYDGAIPSGNSVAIWTLQRLAALSDEEAYAKMAQAALLFFAETVRQIPEAYTFFLMGALHHLWPLEKIVVSGSRSAVETKRILAKLQEKFLPRAVVLFHDEQLTDDGVAQVHICRDFQCLPPLNGDAAIKEIDRM